MTILDDIMREATNRILYGGTTTQKQSQQDDVFTLDKLRAAIKDLPKAPDPVRVFYSVYATKDTDERLFPYSRHRSRRVEKKLIKRFGGVFRKAPAMFRIKNDFYAHPAFRAQIEKGLGK